MINHCQSEHSLAAGITRAASQQTYYTVRYLVDGERAPCAFQAYAYFRWVDDCLDREDADRCERLAFIERQKNLMEKLYRGEIPTSPTREESMLVDLVRCDTENSSGLQSYIRNMMAVMSFDAGRRGRMISRQELSGYTRGLATAVTEALHYFIGHHAHAPRNENRYRSAAAAHITHMLRDTVEDVRAGYYNIPENYLESRSIDAQDVESPAYREWVKSRVGLARRYFKAGKDHLAQVASLRCRIAGYAYTARFEKVLDIIEQEGYQLRSNYQDLKSVESGLRMSAWALVQAVRHHGERSMPGALPVR